MCLLKIAMANVARAEGMGDSGRVSVNNNQGTVFSVVLCNPHVVCST